MLGYGGKIYTWFGKEVMEWTGTGQRAGWRPLGLSGKTCYGGCVAAGYLIVCLEARDARSEIWAWNGAGWWLVTSDVVNNDRWCWPVALYGAANYDVMVFRQGTRQARVIRLVWRDDLTRTYPTDGKGEFISAMIDCGERDKAKAWRKVGCVFASPEKRGTAGSVDPVGVYLDTMTDNSGVWSQVAGQTVNGNFNANHTFTLDADVASDAVVSRWLQLRVRFSSVNDWSPLLAGIWAEFEVLDSPARRRRWTFTVMAQDQVIDRDEQPVGQSGQQLIAGLWSAWQGATTVTFRDIDYDADPVQRRVRIVGIREEVAVPGNAGKWGQSRVKLDLVEV